VLHPKDTTMTKLLTGAAAAFVLACFGLPMLL
jgi:hypothetical protein